MKTVPLFYGKTEWAFWPTQQLTLLYYILFKMVKMANFNVFYHHLKIKLAK